MRDTRKIVQIIIAVVLTALIISGIWLLIYSSTTKKYEANIAALNAELARWGTATTVYTVASTVKSGDASTSDTMTSMTLPSTCVTADMVTNPSEVENKFYKVPLVNGVPLTKSLFMDEIISDDVRDVDLVLSRRTVGLAVGDYIDINITMPYGDDYIVIPKKRIYAVNESSVKVYLTREQWHTYQGALVDYYLNMSYGATIYAQKYVEPGLQAEATPYYAVPDNVLAVIQKDPNVVDAAYTEAAKSWRASIEQLLVIFRDDEDTVDSDGAKLSENRAKFDESVAADGTTDAETKAKEVDTTTPAADGFEETGLTEEVVE